MNQWTIFGARSFCKYRPRQSVVNTRYEKNFPYIHLNKICWLLSPPQVCSPIDEWYVLPLRREDEVLLFYDVIVFSCCHSFCLCHYEMNLQHIFSKLFLVTFDFNVKISKCGAQVKKEKILSAFHCKVKARAIWKTKIWCVCVCVLQPYGKVNGDW